jgi:carboxypeptidase Taq
VPRFRPPPEYEELKARLAKIHDLDKAKAVLEWEARTTMPPGGASARSEEIASLERARHERFTADEIGSLLEELHPDEERLDPDSDVASLIRVARRDWDKARRIPAALGAQIALVSARAERAWEEARERSDFSLLLPHLEEVVELKLRYAELFDAERVYDPLLDDFEPGMTTAEVERLLEELKSELIPLAAAIAENGEEVDDSCLYGNFPEEQQRELVLDILRSQPLHPGWWRLDPSAHPFASAFSITDVRITTRYSEGSFATSLLSALHELGHALYESGIDRALERTPLCDAPSLGLHESQSRLWENMVGRSRAFWKCFLPRVQTAFPSQLEGVAVEDFYRALNKVRPSLIRTEADEVTYNLHIILRFELEQELFEGKLALKDLPEAWNARVRDYLGLDVPNDAQGVLQDVHWAGGLFGYFPTYAIGNIVSGQIWEAVCTALPDLDEQIEGGEFGPLREWLRESLHRHGRKFTPAETIELAVGGPIDAAPYLRYLREKTGEIYGIGAPVLRDQSARRGS